MTPPRPLFVRDFPRVPTLDALVEAFARGDYARVRADGPKLAESSQETDQVRRAARMLVERTRPDPLSVWLLVIAGVLLVVLSVYWMVHGKPLPGDAPTVSQHVR